MKYPNLVAEYYASGYRIETLCDHTMMDEELIREILTEDTAEDFTPEEKRALCGLFQARPDYLFARGAARLKPGKPRTKHRHILLCVTLQKVSQLGAYCRHDKHQITRALNVLEQMNKDVPVLYAQYRWAMKNLELILAVHAERTPSPAEKEKRGGSNIVIDIQTINHLHDIVSNAKDRFLEGACLLAGDVYTDYFGWLNLSADDLMRMHDDCGTRTLVCLELITQAQDLLQAVVDRLDAGADEMRKEKGTHHGADSRKTAQGH